VGKLERYERPAIDPAWFIRPSGHDGSAGIHGVGHTVRVWTHALALAEALGFAAWQAEALSYAAIWHDIGRTNEGADYYHGAKSAGRVVGLGLHADVDELVCEVALFAVTHHCGDEGHARRASWGLPEPDASWDVFRVLKDADALDRVRLGAGDLDPSQLRFPQSHKRIEVAWELLRAGEE
jgi:hypothetical protein